jgi:predicted nucleotidyltransferase
MIDEQTIRQAAEILLAAAVPGSRVILFGSYARGQAGPRSDEMVRLGKVLAHLGVAVDVLVASEQTFQYWVDTPNTVYNRAAREGRVYEQVA